VLRFIVAMRSPLSFFCRLLLLRVDFRDGRGVVVTSNS
jgi:hypothetical protein